MKKLRSTSIIIYSIMATLIVIAGCDTKKSTGPQGDEYANVSIVVQDEYGRPVIGGKVTSNPPTEEKITDADGRVVFENLLVRKYTFYLRRTDFPVYTKNITPLPGNNDDNILIVKAEPPSVSIQYPGDDTYLSIYNIKFIGVGFDPEDGVLPDSTLIWTSSIDGLLGTGHELVLESLTAGDHEITLEVTDSDQKKASSSIIIKLVNYHPDTFFPMPKGAHWKYNHTTEKFSLVNDEGNIENWVLEDIVVDFNTENIRTSHMTYKVVVLNRTREYQYTVVDYLEQDGDDIYVTKSTESLKVWKGNPYGNPDDDLFIQTVYLPRYLLIESVLDPTENSTRESTYWLDVSWTFSDPFHGTRTFPESFHINTVVSIGEQETITTKYNEQYTVLPITISERGSMKKMFLSRGLGIIRHEYNSFAIKPTADLIMTNLANIAAKSGGESKITSLFDESVYPRLNEVSVPAEDGPERLRELRNILQGFSMP